MMDLPAGQFANQEIRRLLSSVFLESVGNGMSDHGMLALVLRFGGADLIVPKRPGPDHFLREILTAPDIDALCRHAAGSRLYVPLPKALKKYRKAMEMRQARDQGRTVREIAREHQISERSVYRTFRESRDWFQTAGKPQ